MTSPEAPPAPPPTTSIVRWSLANSTGLAALYLVLSGLVELARRLGHSRGAERLSLGLESLPARTLESLGLLEPLRRLWMEGRLSPLAGRLVYGLTTVLLIYALGLVVAGLMWGALGLVRRLRPPAAR
jgi:hypothetical protein